MDKVLLAMHAVLRILRPSHRACNPEIDVDCPAIPASGIHIPAVNLKVGADDTANWTAK
jgi:hypothetical protein